MRSKKAFVVFKDSNCWTNAFTKKEFGHCFLLIESKDGGFIRVDANRKRIDVRYFDIRNYEREKNTTLLELKILDLKDTGPNHVLFGLFTCVSIIKYFLQIRCFAITPYGFYKKLLKMTSEQAILTVKRRG